MDTSQQSAMEIPNQKLATIMKIFVYKCVIAPGPTWKLFFGNMKTFVYQYVIAIFFGATNKKHFQGFHVFCFCFQCVCLILFFVFLSMIFMFCFPLCFFFVCVIVSFCFTFLFCFTNQIQRHQDLCSIS